MAVRNLKGRTRVPVSVWIPPNTEAQFKLTIERSDGTVDDISQQISYWECEDFVTESIGRFTFRIWNPSNVYTNLWTGNEIVRYYKDYAATATTLRFRGRVELPSNKSNKLEVKGRSESKDLLTLNVTSQYDAVECSVILQDIFTAYKGSKYTFNNVNVTTKFLTIDWYEKPFWDAVKELCTAAGFECYIDADLDVNYFLSGSRLNEDEAIVHDYNLMPNGVIDFAPDLTLVRNKITVSGAVQDGVQVFYTVESDHPKYGVDSSLGVVPRNVNDDSVTTYNQAKDLGDFILEDEIIPPDVGEVQGWLLASLQPGQKLRVSAPDDNLPPGDYISVGYKDIVDIENGKQTTTAYLNKEPRKISHILKNRVEQENAFKQNYINPEQMEQSYNDRFDSDTGTHTNTEITEGVLRLASGQSSGNWVSTGRTLTENLDEAFLQLIGSKITGAQVSVSGNGGVSYQNISQKQKITISSAKGKTLQVKISLTDAETEIDSVSILYKEES